MNYKAIFSAVLIWAVCTAVPAAAADEDAAADVSGAYAAAEQREDSRKDDGAVPADGQDDKVSGAAQYLNGQADDKHDAGKQNDNGRVLTDEELAALPVVSPVRLGDADFHIGGIHRGDRLEKVTHLFGSPAKYSKSAHYTTVQYTGKDNLTMRVRSRNEAAGNLQGNHTGAGQSRAGVESIFLSDGDDVVIGRSLKLKMPAELVVRHMGIPSNVLRDADANIYYFVYENPDRDTAFVFAAAGRKLERVALMPVRQPYGRDGELPAQNSRTERDFHLMGFSLNTPFEANKYNMWNNLVKRDGSDFWLYGDYGVEVDRRHTIKKVFLLTNNAYTSRGATLGYHISTVLALYGRPDKVEIGPDADKAVDAYYYRSPYQQDVSLVFVVNHWSQYVDDVLLISSPIKDLQDPMARYGLK